MREKTRHAAYADIESPHVRNFSLNASFDAELWRLVLLPVYLATYRFQSKTYQVAINGQTGKVAGDKPVAWNKVWWIVAALVAPGLLLAGLGLLFAVVGGAPLFILGAVVFMLGAAIAVFIIRQALQAGEA
jgi:hypothetical protein